MMEDDMEIEIPEVENDINDTANNQLEKEDHSEKTSPRSSPSVHNNDDDDDDDGGTCPVCLEAWTNCGAHRICSLKCGHLFGHKCILRWLDSQSKKLVPLCKKSVKRSDIRCIYAKKLIAVDNMELENMRMQLEQAVMQKNAALQSVSKYISREQVLKAEIEQLKKKIQELSLGGKQSDLRLTLQSPVNRIRLYLEKNIEVCNKVNCRDCRVFDISVPQDVILIAARSSTDLFGGFGLKKLSLANYKPIKYAPLHAQPIRDMCINSVEDKILTVSSDKKFKITEIQNMQTTSTVNLDSAPWACSWNPSNLDELTIGTQNGTINIYDIRRLQEPVSTFIVPGDFSPVVSLVGIKETSKSDILLVAKLNSVWAFERHSDNAYSRHLLPLEGPFLSLRYNQDLKQILVSSRPNSQIAFARHTVCYLEKTTDPDKISCNVVYNFKGGSTAKLLAKTSCFLPDNIVAAHHETRKSILLYSINTGEEVGSCPTHDNLVLDLKGLATPSGKFLTYLNEKRMEFFKFNAS
ncbi:hypothetical protein ABEB36_005320 [Hypothenemus hampei]|uniref:Anaphase-promoting complex subunit 11 n=1 Tax=Hypothenemus hampei TaxID=57062 RepID=A0ABD1EY77_HYPHA